MPKITDRQGLEALRQELLTARKAFHHTVIICGGTGCLASRCTPVIEAFQAALASEKLAQRIALRVTGCHGFCEQGPLVVIEPEKILYRRVCPEDVPAIVARTLMRGEVLEDLLYVDPATGVKCRGEGEIPFYRAQDRLVLGRNRAVDPRSIEDYIAADGYSALAKALFELKPDEVITEIKTSGLRGRGGAGFPTGRKWEACRAAAGDVKYVVCNADEGDPGAYMDRSLLEGNPHAILEGMLIGAYAIGAAEGYIYVRNEYPLAVKNTRLALQQAREYGLLGENILGSSLCFDIRVVRGGGAFVCGESTALMASIEGRAGEPRAKEVHTTARGLWGRPANLNNVETWANVPLIIGRGAAAFAAKGTSGSKGTKIFALTGKVVNTGLVEVAMGTPLADIVQKIGGGAPQGRRIKAVQTGGPSGGCLPQSLFHLPVDFESLTEAGTMVGSGGMVVMDEDSCMVDTARYFLSFLQDESCGKCVPCRLGISRMLEIVTDIASGRGRPEQLDLLEDLARTVAEASLCGLGKSAPNPVLSTLRYFREEFEAHIRDKRCPAGVCRALVRFRISAEKCTGCGVCRGACPAGAVSGRPQEPHVIAAEKCSRCGICRSECKSGAVLMM